jgi:hypothetical protein
MIVGSYGDRNTTNNFGIAARGLLDVVMLVASGLAAVWFLAIVVIRCRAGVDLSDEAFYLIWISDPWRYQGSVTQFGFVYNPLFRLVGYDIALLRQSNVIITVCLTCTVFGLILRDAKLPANFRFVIAGVLSTVALLPMASWLVTPNYNTLCWQGILVVLIGVLLAYPILGERRQIFGTVLIAAGGVLVFLAKPTSAVLIGSVIAVFIMRTSEQPVREIFFAAAVASIMLLFCALAIDGSIAAFAERLQAGTRTVFALMPEFSVFRGDRFEAPARVIFHFFLAVMSGVAWTRLTRKKSMQARVAQLAVIVILCVGTVLVTTFTQLAAHRGDTYWVYDVYTVPLLWVAGAMVLAPLSWKSVTNKRPPRATAISIIFLLAPFCYALGSGNNVWRQAIGAGALWAGSGLSYLAFMPCATELRRTILGLAVGSMTISAALIASGMEYPYHQAKPLRLHTEPVRIEPRGQSVLYLDRDYAGYVAALRLAMTQDGKGPKAILDMTGRLPGNAYLLDAVAPGAPWLQSGWAGGTQYLYSLLDTVPCGELVSAWVITAPDAKVAFPPDALQRYGIALEVNYVQASRIRYPDLKHNNIRSDLLIWKPARNPDDAIAECVKGRGFEKR